MNTTVRLPRSWPVLLLAAPAFVAIWSGWVGLGSLTGFGRVRPLPGIWDSASIDTAITLPIGVETYAAYALHVWLTRGVDGRATRFAKWSALGSLVLGAGGQVAYHLMVAAGMTHAPWQITAVVACLPVAVLGMGAALAHLVTETPRPVAASGAVELPTPSPAGEAWTPPPRTATSRSAEPDASVPPANDTSADAEDDEPDDADGQDVPAPRPAPRQVRRGGGRPAGSTHAVTVRRLQAKHPDWTTAQIAAKAGCAPRTARRYLTGELPESVAA